METSPPVGPAGPAGTLGLFGHWPSPLAPAAVAAGQRTPSALSSFSDGLFWLERRPEEGGRQVLVRGADGASPVEVSPPDADIASRVHEYGGGAYCIVPSPRPAGTGARLAYVEAGGQQVWWGPLGPGPAAPPVALTPPGDGWRFGDLWATSDGAWVLAVRERVGGTEGAVERDVVALSTDDPGRLVELCRGRQFFAAPRSDAGGRRLAWVCWDHPDMSWDAAELWVADLGLGERPLEPSGRYPPPAGRRVVGGDGVSVGQPRWLSDGRLVFACDAAGWWQPWLWDPTRPDEPARRLCADEAEFHEPDWALGQATMVELPGRQLACRRRHLGRDEVGLLELDGGRFRPIAQPCVSVSALCRFGDGVAWLGATPWTMAAPWWWAPGRQARRLTGGVDGASGAPSERLVADAGSAPGRGPVPDMGLAREEVSLAEHFSLVGSHGRTVHGLFYEPRLGAWTGAPGTKPPLVVFCHGGPTGSADAGFDPVVQLFTTRGLAVAAVDYAGSSGYGRSYREALAGQWGVADVDDVIDAARHLTAADRVDGRSMAVRGRSAGGLTALAALVRGDVFAGAVSWYGVTDLEALARATHDFERHYLDRLVGPLPAARVEYDRRSPRLRVADISGAVLLLQGRDDPVVPLTQAETMASALEQRGLRCRLETFAGEGHGFRRAATVTACLQAELAFYQEVLFPVSGGRAPVAGKVQPARTGSAGPAQRD